MPCELRVDHGSLHLLFEIVEDAPVRFLRLGAGAADHRLPAVGSRGSCPLVELQAIGENQHDHHGSRYTGTSPGNRLRHRSHRWEDGRLGRVLVIVQATEGVEVETRLELVKDLPVLRAETSVTNTGAKPLGIEYLASLAYSGIGVGCQRPVEDSVLLHHARNVWYAECQWHVDPLIKFDLRSTVSHTTTDRLLLQIQGSWSTNGYLPMGALEDTEAGECLLWQIEHSGSWHAELGFASKMLCLRLGGPTWNEHHWFKELAPGARFTSVPVAVTAVKGGFEPAMAAMTDYRRRLRRDCADVRKLPVIFNDYMNCLFGDPTTEKLRPLIAAAAEVGCEYFTVDCGWYSDGGWWDSVGEWLPSAKRFPGGIREVLDLIRAKGMVPGLWLELEVMGINCPLAKKVPDDWFFGRHGRRVVDNFRYLLDYRNPAVRAHADAVIDRVASEYGAGYIKMDYNINAGTGTDRAADSAGDGLLGHQRAYLAWLDGVFARHPDLVIENCGSGGLRMDYAMLARCSIQSTSDQTDYRLYPYISAACATAAAPEQAAIWSYPLKNGDVDEVVVNMVNAMLGRIHQSGHLAELSSERLAAVREGITAYKALRGDIPASFPFWPLGLPRWGAGWTAHGLRGPERTHVAVWRLEGEDPVIELPIPHLKGRAVRVVTTYPASAEGGTVWSPERGVLTVRQARRTTARVLTLTVE